MIPGAGLPVPGLSHRGEVTINNVHYVVTLSIAHNGVIDTLMTEYVAEKRITTYADIQVMIKAIADHFGFDWGRMALIYLFELVGDDPTEGR